MFHRVVKWGMIYLGLLIMTSACTTMCTKKHSEMSPEEVVEAYLDIAFGMTDVSQRNQLAMYTTGILREVLVTATDKTIKEAYIDRKFKLESYAVVERQDRTPREVEITFQLVYKELGSTGKLIDESKAANVTTENTVSVQRVHKKWMLAEVLGKKTTIDFPLESAPTIKPRPAGQQQDSEPVEIDEAE